MNKDKIKLLEWFINFAYANIEALEDSEALKLWFEFDSIVRTGFFKDKISGIGGRSVSLVSDFRDRLLDSQAWFALKFHGIMEKIEQIPQREIKEWTTDKECFEGFGLIRQGFQPTLEPFLNDLLTTPSIDTQFNISAYVPIQPDYRGEGDKAEARWNPLWRDEATVRVYFLPEDQFKEALLLAFLRAINGIKISTVNRCGECEQWFFHFSKREKIYCSNKCAARKGNRERRVRLKKEKPEAYDKELAENARRARESYERKVKAKSGKNVIVKKKQTKQISLFK